MVANAWGRLEVLVVVEGIALQHNRAVAAVHPRAGPDGEEASRHMGIMVDVVDNLPLAQPAIAGQGNAARTDTAERQRTRAQRIATMGQRLASGRWHFSL